MSEPGLTREELRSRTVTGVTVLVVRTLLIRGIGFAGSIVLARLLAPHDFGLVAIGLTLQAIGGTLGHAGLGASLITRKQGPSREELSALLGLQLTVTIVFTLVASAVAISFGARGWVVVALVAATPIQAIRTCGLVVSERELNYRDPARAEVAQTLVYTVSAVIAAALGGGVWALAGATDAGIVAGTIVMLAAVPGGRVRPRLAIAPIRGILRYGTQFQAASMLWLGRETGVNLGIAAIGGTTVFGLLSVAERLLLIPGLLGEAVLRVSYSSVARMMHGEIGAPADLERSAATLGLLNAAVATPLVGGAPALMPALFGSVWAPAAYALPGYCVALVINGALDAIGTNALYARGGAATVLRLQLISSIVGVTLILALVGPLGITGVSIGVAVGATVSAVLLTNGVRRAIGARLGRGAFGIWTGAVAGAAAGWFICREMPQTFPSAIACMALAEVIFLAVARALARDELEDTIGIMRRSLRPGLRARLAGSAGRP